MGLIEDSGRTDSIVQMPRHGARCLRRPFQLKDRQVLSSRVKVDFQTEPYSRLSLDERAWVGARCSARPVRTRFPAWRTIGRAALEVDLVGGSAGQAHVRPVFVVPNLARGCCKTPSFPEPTL